MRAKFFLSRGAQELAAEQLANGGHTERVSVGQKLGCFLVNRCEDVVGCSLKGVALIILPISANRARDVSARAALMGNVLV